MKSSPSIFDLTNQGAFGDPAVALHYSRNLTSLFAGEVCAIDHVAATVQRRPILDLGVGAGRTTAALLSISSHYVGIDYAPAMIEVCRKTYPSARFEIGDARDLSAFDDRQFGMVMFSFNGIDYVTRDDRIQILREVRRVLADDGVFVFSSHDFRYDPRAGQSMIKRNLGRVKDRIVDARRPPDLRHKMLGVGCDCRAEVAFGGRHTIFVCYISSEAQVDQLRDVGFGCDAIFNTKGQKIAPGTIETVAGPWLYYVAMKLSDASS